MESLKMRVLTNWFFLAYVVHSRLLFLFPKLWRERFLAGRQSESPLYCYSVWMRHVIKIYEETGKKKFARVAEIGPGYSLGVGLMALITGANEYVAIDKVKFVDKSKVMVLFDELLQLFRDRSPIPGYEVYPNIKPALKDTNFPCQIYTSQDISILTDANRIAAIRKQLDHFISSEYCENISYNESLSEEAQTTGGFDLILSQAVLEHVDDLEDLYQKMATALAYEGVQSHQIDFKHHKTSFIWNGHWMYTDRQFEIMRNKEPFFINREPVSVHKRSIARSGCEIRYVEKIELQSAISLGDCRTKSIILEPNDLLCAGAYIICSKVDRLMV